MADDEYVETRENYDDIREQARDSRLGMPFEPDENSARSLSGAEMREILEERWQQDGFRFLHVFEPGHVLSSAETNSFVSAFVRRKIRERVDDPETAEKLVPTDHPYGAKRPPMDYDDYYGTYNREDVSVVDVGADPITEVTPDGVRTTAGAPPATQELNSSPAFRTIAVSRAVRRLRRSPAPRGPTRGRRGCPRRPRRRKSGARR
jgi:cyclohexanone monooxygenase